MPKPLISLPITYYTPEDIQRIADMECELCGRPLRECECSVEDD